MATSTEVSIICKRFKKIHDKICKQKYGGYLPYSFHLTCVWSQASKFIHLFDPKIVMKNPNNHQGKTFDYYDLVRLSCYGHDSIEDARLSYNDVKSMMGDVYLGKMVADVVYCLTDEKGKNRSERKSDKFYEELKANKVAVFVKLSDIAANTLFSKLTGNHMYKKYKAEFPHFKEKVYIEEFKEFFDYVENL